MHQRVTAMQELRQQAQLTPEQLRFFGEHAHGLKSGVCMIGCNRLALVCHKLGAPWPLSRPVAAVWGGGDTHPP
jgi:hypothetical protein